MKNNVKRILLLLLTVIGLYGGCMTVSAATTYSWEVKGTNDYTLMATDDAGVTTAAKSAIYNLQESHVNGVTFEAGYYYVINGKISRYQGNSIGFLQYTNKTDPNNSALVGKYIIASEPSNTNPVKPNVTLANGIYSAKVIVNGDVNTSKNGWFKANNCLYYAKNGELYHNQWVALPSYGGGSTPYAYYFESNGTLRTNFFGVTGSIDGKSAYRYYLQKVNYIDVNRTSHTVTYYTTINLNGKNYKAPLFACICSTSRSAKGTKLGTFYLAKTSARKWFIYKKSNPYHYYQYGVLLHGSASWFHSTMYATKNAKRLVKPTGYSGYNNLGTNQTTACIRVQAAVAKLNYDIARDFKVTGVTKKKQRVYVHVFKSSAKGAFGKISLAMTTGKISKSTKIDPTDPKYNGFGGNNQAAIRTLTPKFK